MGRDVRSLMLSIQHFLCRPRRRPHSKVPRIMILGSLSLPVACPNHARFHSLTVARKGSCGPTKKLILLRTQSVVFCSLLQVGDLYGKVSSCTWFRKPGSFFFLVSKKDLCFTAVEEDGSDKRLVELGHVYKADGVETGHRL